MTFQRLTTCLVLALAAACARHEHSQPPDRPTPPPRFETRIEIDTGTTQHMDFAVGDFNGDDQVDMAVVGLTGELQVLIGSSSVFTPGQQLDLGGGTFWIDQGDVDGDGDLDLAVLTKDLNAVTVLFNDGNAQFSFGPTFAIGPGGLQVLIGDADDNGTLDLMVVRLTLPEIQVFLGDGHGAFAPGPAITLPDGGETVTLALGDVTRDGVPDLVVSDVGLDRVLVYPGRPLTVDFAPTPTILAVPGSPAACSLGDLSGDGRTDIAVSAFGADRFVVITDFPNVPGPVSYSSFELPVAGHAALSTIADVTGDGRADLIACVVGTASVVVAPQLPGGGLDVPFQLDATGLPLRPVVVDVDHNGRGDLLVLSGLESRVNLWLARDSGRLNGARNHATGVNETVALAAADFDGDGRTEVIVGGRFDATLSILRGNADADLTVDSTVALGVPVTQLRVVDLDVDGRPDLIAPGPTGVAILQNLSTPGNLVLQPLPTNALGNGPGPFGATAADLDRDGRFDLIIADYQSGDLQILRGGATPFDFSAAPQLIPVGGSPVDVVAADFTGDGIVDLAVSRSGMSDVLLLRNDGRGNLTQLLSVPVGAAPNRLMVDDFDGDGRSDLVVANAFDDTVTVLAGSASGFQIASYAAGRFPVALLTGDLTNDGRPDILVAAGQGQEFRVLVNDGAGGFANVFPFPGMLGAVAVTLADVDADGLRDLVITSTVSSRASVVRALPAPLDVPF